MEQPAEQDGGGGVFLKFLLLFFFFSFAPPPPPSFFFFFFFFSPPPPPPRFFIISFLVWREEKREKTSCATKKTSTKKTCPERNTGETPDGAFFSSSLVLQNEGEKKQGLSFRSREGCSCGECSICKLTFLALSFCLPRALSRAREQAQERSPSLPCGARRHIAKNSKNCVAMEFLFFKKTDISRRLFPALVKPPLPSFSLYE